MKCPTCGDTTLVMSERNGIEIDYCPECRGVWLDRGELDKIIQKSHAVASNEMPSYAPQSRDNPRLGYYEKDHYKYKRKKSFLEEIFD